MHVVVVCPRCKGATAVREDQKSATCPRCGRSYDPRRARAYHRSSDPAEVARAVAEMNARLEGGFQVYEADARSADATRADATAPRGLEAVVSRVSRVRGRQRQLDEAVRLLCGRSKGWFSSEELSDVLTSCGWEPHAAEEALRKLREGGLVVEFRADCFRPA